MITRFPTVTNRDNTLRSYAWVHSQIAKDQACAITTRRPEANRVEFYGKGFQIVWLKTNECYLRFQIVRARTQAGHFDTTNLVLRGALPQ